MLKAVTPGAKTCCVEHCIIVITHPECSCCREHYEECMRRELREEISDETETVDRVEERTGTGKKEHYW